ncbi:2-amino-4-hydroxy-6-hydroxymethyldihydropteridine diphosphokinase [Umboniibacter marinipuniceus]|uniref:2-amino-4-hydroxy-6-hydroxymethyldihydropteridine diphosphokinase n=1 Tax=Umboniibacter marinipuniceus TaxID=569599 RepID=A0A3M0A764_9GAMM|nr:2-amino-4-hydroxy-6-hydroxymethyldihydropteridine diphosphokinase [Umboniibacter marinipuniceus]RMA80134.1 2-amino-4-hydroxy-6-hydroxymethyldihydropteridine diphosphokinase [Umboniibacter marinipuniceus]
MRVVYLGFGSNTQREFFLAKGLRLLQEQVELVSVSPVYRSDSVGFNGAAFFNFCVSINTSKSVSHLKAILKRIEDICGRDRKAPKYSGRTLDIDILYVEGEVGEVDGVQLPRQEVSLNAFVLKPLVDIAPQLMDPRDGSYFRDQWSDYDKTRQPLIEVSADFLGITASTIER